MTYKSVFVSNYRHYYLQTQPSVSQFWDASPDLVGAGNTSNSRYLSDFEEISLLGMVDYFALFNLNLKLSCFENIFKEKWGCEVVVTYYHSVVIRYRRRRRVWACGIMCQQIRW